MNNRKVHMLSYAVAVPFDDAGTLDGDMGDLGLSLPDWEAKPPFCNRDRFG